MSYQGRAAAATAGAVEEQLGQTSRRKPRAQQPLETHHHPAEHRRHVLVRGRCQRDEADVAVFAHEHAVGDDAVERACASGTRSDSARAPLPPTSKLGSASGGADRELGEALTTGFSPVGEP